MLQRLFQFKGGVKPETHKAPSVQVPIGIAPLPARNGKAPSRKISTA